ncbi:MAG: NUDIX hydrolase [Nitrososphaerales archaeon]
METVDEIDELDRVISLRSLDECFALGLLHRAVSVFLWNPNNEVYLQRRNLFDDWFPGYWTASCTGHVKSGENCFDASVRELKEELGIDSTRPDMVLKFIVPPINYADSIEYELMYVLESRSGDSEIILDPTEVEEGRFLSVPELKRFFKKNSERITPDALLSFDKYVKAKRL